MPQNLKAAGLNRLTGVAAFHTDTPYGRVQKNVGAFVVFAQVAPRWPQLTQPGMLTFWNDYRIAAASEKPFKQAFHGRVELYHFAPVAVRLPDAPGAQDAPCKRKTLRHFWLAFVALGVVPLGVVSAPAPCFEPNR